MYEAPPIITSSPPLMTLARTCPFMLLFAITMAVVSLCQFVHKADAGGKGKGKFVALVCGHFSHLCDDIKH